MKLLALETATDICGVALSEDGRLQGIVEQSIPRRHAEQLPLFVEQLKTEYPFSWKSLDGIAVSIGPGSFTGLRIGLSFAKGLAFTHNLPIIPVPTLMTLALGSRSEDTQLRAFLFSHGDILFHQQFRVRDGKIQDQSEIKAQSWKEILPELPSEVELVHYGCGKFLQKRGMAKEVTPSAKWVAVLAQRYYGEWVVNELDRLTPHYVSTFQVRKSF
jgi:tRNA threonylcarbamoyladenosine biosynthesis protein TsaB